MERSLRVPSTIRCIARCDAGEWVASTLEFGLAVQASTYHDAKKKLEEQILDFVRTALEQDAPFRNQLLRRRAPLSEYLLWHRLTLQKKLRAFRRSPMHGKTFIEKPPRLAVA